MKACASAAARTAARRWIIPALTAAVLGACASGSAVSEADKMFLGGAASWDANKDNVVTCSEWKTYAAGLFARADTNADGALAAGEFETLARIDRTYSIADLKYFDTNRDGTVDRAEFVERPNPVFALADKNKDCQLDSAEMAQARGLAAPVEQTKPMVNPREGI